ncbi:MAG: lipoate--protein ligase family protein [Elusimicrobia bacterium]|nr:lipoate--protein ligase family protein [Elusimicrobiota bacterium]
MNLRCVNDIPRNCALNISLDEVFFTKEPFEDIFRFYRWTEPAYTIGYFQKIAEIESQMIGKANGRKRQTENDESKNQMLADNVKIVRRLTGGLAVLHNTDLSYSLIVSDNIWEYIYDQEKTYKIIHENIRKSLEKVNIFCDKTNISSDKKPKYSCVQTLYKDDLLLNGRKIVGSCQRRRGKKILVEGSIHLALSDEQVNIFTQDFFKNLSEELKCNITNNKLTEEEINYGKKLCTEKYSNDKWNKLF